MSLERGTGGKNASYGWSNLPEPVADSDVDAWVAALWAKPFTYAEYEEMRAIAASRTAEPKPKPKPKLKGDKS